LPHLDVHPRFTPLLDQVRLLVGRAGLPVIRARRDDDPTVVVYPTPQKEIHTVQRQARYTAVELQRAPFYEIGFIEEGCLVTLS